MAMAMLTLKLQAEKNWIWVRVTKYFPTILEPCANYICLCMGNMFVLGFCCMVFYVVFIVDVVVSHFWSMF